MEHIDGIKAISISVCTITDSGLIAFQLGIQLHSSFLLKILSSAITCPSPSGTS